MVRSLVFKAALAAALLFAPGCAIAGPLFDGAAPSGDFQLFPFWKKVLDDMNAATPQPPSGVPRPVAQASATTGLEPAALTMQAPSSPPPAAMSCADERHCIPASWTDFLAGLAGIDPRSQLEAVNRWANAKPYVEDLANWGVPDYWETPGEFIAHGGDCEDFAIAKYFSLIRLGLPAQDLRIVIVSDSKAHAFHAVLAAEVGGTTWLLDNQIAMVVPLASQTQYTPIYSLNAQGWWLHSQPVIQVAANIVITSAPISPAAPAPLRVAAAN